VQWWKQRSRSSSNVWPAGFVAAAVCGGRFSRGGILVWARSATAEKAVAEPPHSKAPASEGGRYKCRRGHLKVAATLEGGAGGDFADFSVFDNAAAEFFQGGLQHCAADVVPVDVEVRKRFEEAAERLDERVDFRQAR